METPIDHAPTALTVRVRPAVGRPLARLFLLHGVGGNETNLIPLADAVDDRLEVVFVRAPLVMGPGQYAWFPVRFGPQGPIIDAARADASRVQLRELVAALANSDEEHVPAIMAGFSQGGIMSASVALTAPEHVSRFAILSGRILPELAPDLASRVALSNTAALITHGQYDDKLPIAFAEQADALLTELGVRHDVAIYPVGHTLNDTIVGDVSRWINLQATAGAG